MAEVGDYPMNYTESEINSAINEAENAASSLAADSKQVTVTNGVLLRLIAGTQGSLDKISELEAKIGSIECALRS